MKDNSLVPADEIWYTTVDGKTIKGCMEGTEKYSHRYRKNEGKCVITFYHPIKEIKHEAFKGCTSLKEIVLPEGVTEIWSRVFQGCTSLQEIILPSSLESIGYSAFQGCTSLQEIVLPSSLTELCATAFEDCTSLHKVVISEGVNEIWRSAFRFCKSLREVVIPLSVKTIHEYAFVDCNNLKAIYVPKGKVDFYKECLQSEMRWLVVEEGSDLPVKGENFIAKDLSFAPTLRMVVPKNNPDNDILSAAEEHLEDCSKSAIIKWVLDSLNIITDSKEPYEGA